MLFLILKVYFHDGPEMVAADHESIIEIQVVDVHHQEAGESHLEGARVVLRHDIIVLFVHVIIIILGEDLHVLHGLLVNIVF